MCEPFTSTLHSDTDSDSEPNTVGANVFWGHLKTPERSRIKHDPPHTILRSRSTILIHTYESPSKPAPETMNNGEREPLQPALADPSIGSEDYRSDSPIRSSANSANENARNATQGDKHDHGLPIPSLEVDQKSDNEHVAFANGDAPPTPWSALSNIHPIPLGTGPTTAPSTLSVHSLCQSPNPLNLPFFSVPSQDNKTPVKSANDFSQHIISRSTPQTSDNSIRKERRMKLKHNEDRGRFQLLSLSPSSTSILNLVQSPLRDVDNKLTLPQSPLRKKAQRIPLPMLSRSPIKPVGLRLPSPVKLDDPDRIPARRILNPQSPLRTIQDSSLVFSPARRILMTNTEGSAAGSDTVQQTTDIFTQTPSAPSALLFGRSLHHIYLVNASQKSTTSVSTAGSIRSPQKNPEPARSNNYATKAGPSRLPVLSSRTITNHLASNISLPRKRLDPVPSASAPSQIPSPVKSKAGGNTFTLASQIRELPLELKRKRTGTESEEESERPHKKTITGSQSTLRQCEGAEIAQVNTGSSIQKASEPDQGPSILASDVMNVDRATDVLILEPTSETRSMDLSANSSALTSVSHPRRTSRVRKPTTLSSKEPRQRLAQPLLSRTDLPPKLHVKSASLPPSRSASRAGNLERYPDNPRQLQWLTSVNTQRNQESVVELEHQIIRKFGSRPPSPSSKFRVDVKKGREEREARAERRQRRDRNDDGSLVSNVPSSCADIAASSSNVVIESKHLRAPGDDDNYGTPVKVPKPSELHPNIATKTVKWSRDLMEISPTSNPNPPEQQIQPKVKLKSCLLKEPTTFELNFLGNVPHADEPLSGLAKEHVVVSRFIYDNDIQESPRRSKKKVA